MFSAENKNANQFNFNIMEINGKVVYEAPQAEIWEVKLEGPLADSNPRFVSPYDDEGEDW